MIKQDVRIELIRKAARLWLKRNLDRADVNLALQPQFNNEQERP